MGALLRVSRSPTAVPPAQDRAGRCLGMHVAVTWVRAGAGSSQQVGHEGLLEEKGIGTAVLRCLAIASSVCTVTIMTLVSGRSALICRRASRPLTPRQGKVQQHDIWPEVPGQSNRLCGRPPPLPPRESLAPVLRSPAGACETCALSSTIKIVATTICNPPSQEDSLLAPNSPSGKTPEEVRGNSWSGGGKVLLWYPLLCPQRLIGLRQAWISPGTLGPWDASPGSTGSVTEASCPARGPRRSGGSHLGLPGAPGCRGRPRPRGPVWPTPVLGSKPNPVVSEEACTSRRAPQLEIDVGGGGMFSDVWSGLLA